jgi:hypothetical protein
MKKRVFAILLVVALLATCMSSLAGAEGVFKKDSVTLHAHLLRQKAGVFADAVAAYGKPLRFTCDGLIRISDDGSYEHYNAASEKQAEEKMRDGFFAFGSLAVEFGTTTVYAYDGEELVGTITVNVRRRWWIWLTIGLPFTLVELASGKSINEMF